MSYLAVESDHTVDDTAGVFSTGCGFESFSLLRPAAMLLSKMVSKEPQKKVTVSVSSSDISTEFDDHGKNRSDRSRVGRIDASLLSFSANISSGSIMKWNELLDQICGGQ